MRKNKIVTYAATVAALSALLAVSGCGGAQDKLNSAKTAENNGRYQEAAALYAALAIKTAPAYQLPEAQKGKIVQPALWQGEIEKYMAWLTEPAAPFGGTIKTALEGLDRCAQRSEADNTAHTSEPKSIDTLPAFTAQWNTAFNPPPPGTVDWDTVVKSAFNKKFSILRLSAPLNYTYDVNIISRKTSRRINFTLYPATPDTKSQILAPLPQGEYTLIVKSSVDFQKGQYWTSEYTAFPVVAVSETPSIIPIDLRTKVVGKK